MEFKDATDADRAITLCNSGVIACDARLLFELIGAVGNDNASGEYYLTDIVALARAAGLRADVVTCDEAETLGINSRAELAAAEAAFQARARAARWRMASPCSTPTASISPMTPSSGATHDRARTSSSVPASPSNPAPVSAPFRHLEGCHVSRGATVGPYARLRPGAELAEDVAVGNFVEIKNAVIDEGAKVNHLSYIGDAHVGAAQYRRGHHHLQL